MIKIACTSCQKPLSIDETKLPMREVSFPCPSCKTKLTFDRRTVAGEGGAEAHESIELPPMTDPHAPSGDEPSAYGQKALIVGADHPALRQAARSINMYAVHCATAAEGREYYLQEYPATVFLLPQPNTPPPLEAMQPMLAMTPSDRRRGFYVLFADNLRTLDGNAAFLYGVNLVVATKDIGSFAQIYSDAHAYHERLYATLTSVQKQIHGV